uniref:Ribosomal protein S10 n=1 Tax=Rotheca serrata TaxID=1158923 RepID=A0A6M8NYB4_9LAMI|nr:ribosomal protein S10 [Rotheca serrata]QKG04080.1 ribosomal protein S10 [Rotheca serrata]
MLLINRTRRGVSQKERSPKVTTTKIGIVMKSFDHPFLENHFWGLPPYTRQIGLPESRVLYTVLRSPHIDKKSREQFEMKIKKQFCVIKTERHELRKKFFRLKRQRIFGAQYEIVFSCKTRSDKGKLQRLLRSQILALTLSRTGSG